jgi:hypothetical protein
MTGSGALPDCAHLSLQGVAHYGHCAYLCGAWYVKLHSSLNRRRAACLHYPWLPSS